MRFVRLALLGLAVAVAFADSSIVVLALPELLAHFDVSITGVAWIVTSYNVAIVLGALLVLGPGRRLNPWRLTRLGLVVFLLGSLGCALAPTLSALVVWRGVQGLGGAALLVGSLPIMRALASSPARGTAHWALVGALGAAVGPAAGGALTHAFDWRAIFIAQAPIAALALKAGSGLAFTHRDEMQDLTPVLRRLGSNAALALLSAALVGALFLVVILLIDVWGYSPLGAAAVVSALPAGAMAVRPLANRLGLASSTAVGGLLLGAGLGSLALAPRSHAGWAIPGLVLCGIGVGLAVPGLGRAALSGSDRPLRSAAWSIVARHMGLVGGLLLLTPLLAHDLATASTRAERAGTADVLDAAIPIPTKVPLALDLAGTIRGTPKGSLPDFSADFARHRADADATPALVELERSLEETMRAVVTRGFRRALLVAALLALVAGLLWARRLRPAVPVALAGAALLAAQAGAGGLAYGATPGRDPCRGPSTVPGDGIDPAAQRFVLRGLDAAACRLGRSREQLVLDLAKGGEDWVTRVAGRLS